MLVLFFLRCVEKKLTSVLKQNPFEELDEKIGRKGGDEFKFFWIFICFIFNTLYVLYVYLDFYEITFRK
jgi:hypothetical protein